MTYVDGLPGVLSQVSQIQATVGSAAPPGAFESVLAQLSSISQLVGAPAPLPPGLAGSAGSTDSSTDVPGATDLSDSYGWPLEEGSTVFPTAPGASAPSSPALSDQATAPVEVYDERSLQPAAPGAAFYGGLEQATPTSTATGQNAVADAQKYLGVPYLWGGTDPTQGVDCSGLVQDVYADVGISLPRTSQEQATVGTPVASLAQAQPGDLVFFPGSDGTAAAPGHVGIYIGNGMMIDAPHTGTDVRIEPVGDPTAIRRVTGLANTGTEAPTSTGQTSGPIDPAGTAGPSSAEDADFASAASTYGVPEDLLKAVAAAESSFQPGAVSGAGAEGLMQLMPSVASSLGVNPFNPGQSITGAARLLSSYHNQFGSWPLALAAYNAGPGAVREYSGIPPYTQTTAYVSSVLSAAGMAD
jgi:cell wall-associated NlpC family hydrolase